MTKEMVTVIKKGASKEEIRKQLAAVIPQSSKKNILEFAGKLKTAINPLEYQKQMRDEWR
ncbi:MAG: hypothetical protein ACO1OQ_02720 [Rufibacter sp.]